MKLTEAAEKVEDSVPYELGEELWNGSKIQKRTDVIAGEDMEI